jgi:hypothetical protein
LLNFNTSNQTGSNEWSNKARNAARGQPSLSPLLLDNNKEEGQINKAVGKQR